MARPTALLLFTITFGFVPATQLAAWQTDDESKAKVKQLAEELATATKNGDYEKVLSYTYNSVLKKMGGQEKALAAVQQQMQQIADAGWSMESYKIGKPGDLFSTDSHHFMVIPTAVQLTMPTMTITSESYLLGISADQGKSWKFVDGSGIRDKNIQQELLPTLPEKLKLPEPKQPKVERH